MPRAHIQHLETIDAKLRAAGVDSTDAVHGIAAGQPAGDNPALVGLAAVIEALGENEALAALHRIREGRQ